MINILSEMLTVLPKGHLPLLKDAVLGEKVILLQAGELHQYWIIFSVCLVGDITHIPVCKHKN